MGRRRKRPGTSRPIETPRVECTVEYGGGYFVGTPEATAQWEARRQEVAAEVQREAGDRPILRERRREGGPCLFVAPLAGESEQYFLFTKPGPADRMHKSNPDAHIRPCPSCIDFEGEEGDA